MIYWREYTAGMTVFVIFLFAGQSGKAGDDNVGRLSKAQLEKAGKLLLSENAKTRRKTYRGFRKRGAVVVPQYEKLLNDARLVHRARVIESTANRLVGHEEFFGNQLRWKTLRENTMKFLMIDHKKDPGKLRELEGMYKEVERAMKSVTRMVRNTAGTYARHVQQALALGEIGAELEWCETVLEEGGNWDPFSPAALEEYPLDSQERGGLPVYEMADVGQVMKETKEGRELIKRFEIFKSRADAYRALSDANEFNKKCRWANSSLASFCEILNEHRYVMGLLPMRLDRDLSEAALLHSEYMIASGQFAHNVDKKGFETPAKRARKTKFKGNWIGENIYHGSSAPASAFKAWWNSDGHRFIMFGKRANTAGIGVSGGYWTLMTGREDRVGG